MWIMDLYIVLLGCLVVWLTWFAVDCANYNRKVINKK